MLFGSRDSVHLRLSHRPSVARSGVVTPPANEAVRQPTAIDGTTGGNNGCYTLEVPLLGGGLLLRSLEGTLEFLEQVWVSLTRSLANSIITTDAARSISIVLLGGEFLRQEIQQTLERAMMDSQSIQEIHDIWWWILSLASIVCLTNHLTTMVMQGSHTLVLVGLLSLSLINCLVPVTLTGCAALFWFDVFSAETALFVLFVAWVVAAISSRCIMCVLYPSIRHS